MNFNNVRYEKSFGVSTQLPPSDLPEISFAGRSNVGKSSLLNKLFNQKNLARVSQRPGKTATINFFRTGDVRFVDLPGYGYAQVSKSEKRRWSELIEGYFNQDRTFTLVCLLIDIRHPAFDLDATMLEFLRASDLPYLIVLTKGDKLSRSKCFQARDALRRQLGLTDDARVIITSSLSRMGIDEVRGAIESAVAEA